MFIIKIEIVKRDGAVHLESTVSTEKKHDAEHHAKMILIGYNPFDYIVKIEKSYEG
jgi:hypothetical protein